MRRKRERANDFIHTLAHDVGTDGTWEVTVDGTVVASGLERDAALLRQVLALAVPAHRELGSRAACLAEIGRLVEEHARDRSGNR